MMQHTTVQALGQARLVQGAAAALMVPQVLSVIQLLYKTEERTAVGKGGRQGRTVRPGTVQARTRSRKKLVTSMATSSGHCAWG
jgi:hypothetical protein